MKITTILFDLDGTLLPMDQDLFIKSYFGSISKYMVRHGYNPSELINAIFAGTKEMIFNDGTKTNEQAFWDKYAEIYGKEKLADEAKFEEFYINEYCKIKEVCGYNPLVLELFKVIKEKDLRVALATNPVFPQIATKQRIEWTGLKFEDFELVTTYENSTYSKPNLKYYTEILNKLNVTAEECLMVGNDVDDDMVVTKLGMHTYLLTDCLINKQNVNVNNYEHGDILDLINKIKTL